MTVCRSCGAEIRFLTAWDTGRRHPVNLPYVQVIESASGPLTVVRGDGKVFRARRLEPGEPHWDQTVEQGYVSHFATCPDAARWRRNE